MFYQTTVNILEQLQGLSGQGDGFTLIEDLGTFISNSVSLALTIASVASFIYLVYGGINWILAGSDQDKVQKAKERITNAVVGLAIVAASWAVFLVIDHFLGLGIANGSTTTTTTTTTTSQPY